MHPLYATLFVLVTALFAPLLTHAQEGSKQDPLHTILNTSKSMPTRAELDAATPHAERALARVAQQTKAGFQARKRAILLLSLYPNTTTSKVLRTLTQDENPTLRKTALDTLIRTFANLSPEHGKRAVQIIVPFLRDPSRQVREQAVRSLHWVNHPSADTILTRIQKSSFPSDLKNIAKHVQTRRARRLKTNANTQQNQP